MSIEELTAKYAELVKEVPALKAELAEFKAKQAEELAAFEGALGLRPFEEKIDEIRAEITDLYDVGAKVQTNNYLVELYEVEEPELKDEDAAVQWAIASNKDRVLKVKWADLKKAASAYHKLGDPLPNGVIINKVKRLRMTEVK